MRRTRSSSSRRSDGWLRAALAVIVGLHLLALPQVFYDAPLRTDSDTAVMLDAVKQHGTLRWLFGDWLLENGFYRPVSSLSIALDYALYGEAGWGFRLTNWLLMILTVLGAWALVRAYARLAGTPYAEWLALGVGVALSLQQTGLTSVVAKWSAWWFVWMVAVVWVIKIVLPPSLRFPPLREENQVGEGSSPLREGNQVGGGSSPLREGNQLGAVPPAGRGNLQEGVQIILALGALFWGFDRLMATEYTRLITWVPSRTALLGTLFSVWAMYALLLGASQRRWGWLALGGALYLLALGSYEQPIMLVAVVGALAFWRRGDWGSWGARAFAIAVLCAALIVALRFALLHAEPTTYQQQQLRSSLSGPVFSLLTELLPPVEQWQYWRAVGAHLEVLLIDRAGWDYLVVTLLYLGVLVAVWRWRGLLGGAWLWHALAFLPMAFLHFFEHYMYLPQLGKTLFDVGANRVGRATIGGRIGTLHLAEGDPRLCAGRHRYLNLPTTLLTYSDNNDLRRISKSKTARLPLLPHLSIACEQHIALAIAGKCKMESVRGAQSCGCSYLCGAQEHLTTRRYQLQRLKEGMEPLLQMPIRLLEGQH